MNLSDFSVPGGQILLGGTIWHDFVAITMRVVQPNFNRTTFRAQGPGRVERSTGLPGRLFSDRGRHLPPFGVLLD